MLALCKAVDVDFKAVVWSTWICDELQALRLINVDTTYKKVCLQKSVMLSSSERVRYKSGLTTKRSGELFHLRPI